MILKICGMRNQQDLDAAQQAGFDLCGFIFHRASPRYIDPEDAARLATGAMSRVGVFVAADFSEIMNTMEIACLDYAQLHGSQDEAVARAIGWKKVIRVLWPARHASTAALEREARRHRCAFYLLDSGQTGGGSGVNLDWKRLQGLNLPSPWLLAGGLNENNVSLAIQNCAPPGMDFNSGLEDMPGMKNHGKIMAAARTCRAKDII